MSRHKSERRWSMLRPACRRPVPAGIAKNHPPLLRERRPCAPSRTAPARCSARASSGGQTGCLLLGIGMRKRCRGCSRRGPFPDQGLAVVASYQERVQAVTRARRAKFSAFGAIKTGRDHKSTTILRRGGQPPLVARLRTRATVSYQRLAATGAGAPSHGIAHGSAGVGTVKGGKARTPDQGFSVDHGSPPTGILPQPAFWRPTTFPW